MKAFHVQEHKLRLNPFQLYGDWKMKTGQILLIYGSSISLLTGLCNSKMNQVHNRELQDIEYFSRIVNAESQVRVILKVWVKLKSQEAVTQEDTDSTRFMKFQCPFIDGRMLLVWHAKHCLSFFRMSCYMSTRGEIICQNLLIQNFESSPMYLCIINIDIHK